MRSVAILGIGMTPISEHWDKSIRVLAGEAALAFDRRQGLVLEDRGVGNS